MAAVEEGRPESIGGSGRRQQEESLPPAAPGGRLVLVLPGSLPAVPEDHPAPRDRGARPPAERERATSTCATAVSTSRRRTGRLGWHIDGGPGWAEFMHYFSGASRQNGCLRIVPGSHNGPPDSLQERAARLRDERGIPGSPADDGWEDIPLEEEISLEVEPHQLIVRHSRLFHSTWLNRTKAGPLHEPLAVPSPHDRQPPLHLGGLPDPGAARYAESRAAGGAVAEAGLRHRSRVRPGSGRASWGG